MTPEPPRGTWERAAVRACRIAVGTTGAAVAAALIVVGAVVAGVFALGIALFCAIRPAVASVSVTSAGAARSSPRRRATRATGNAADEAGR